MFEFDVRCSSSMFNVHSVLRVRIHRLRGWTQIIELLPAKCREDFAEWNKESRKAGIWNRENGEKVLALFVKIPGQFPSHFFALLRGKDSYRFVQVRTWGAFWKTKVNL